MSKILAFCKTKQEEAIQNQNWQEAQNYQDMHSLWLKRLQEASNG